MAMSTTWEKDLHKALIRITNRHLICAIMSVKKEKHPYQNNQSYCRNCIKWFSIPDLLCTCCGNQLHRTPITLKNRQVKRID